MYILSAQKFSSQPAPVMPFFRTLIHFYDGENLSFSSAQHHALQTAICDVIDAIGLAAAADVIAEDASKNKYHTLFMASLSFFALEHCSPDAVN